MKLSRFVRTALASGSLAAVISLVPYVLSAQNVGASRIEASVHASQARAALRRGDEPEALRLMLASLELVDSPEVRGELANLYERRGERRLASGQWMRLSVTARTLVQRNQAAERAELLRRAQSLLRVWVVPRDAARLARVWFDRDVPRVMPVGGAETMVEGGPHRVRVESPGYTPYEVMVSTGFAEPLSLTVRMLPIGSGYPDSGVSITRRDAARP